MRSIVLGLGIALAFVMGACGDDEDDTDSGEPVATETATEVATDGEPTPTPVPEETPTPEPDQEDGAERKEPAWEVDLGDGMNTFAATDGEVVVVSATDANTDANGDSSGLLVGLDPENGDELWRHEMEAGTLVPGVSDGVAAVADLDGVVHAFDAESGEPLWTYESDSAPAQVVVREGTVFAADANLEWFGADGVEARGEPQGRIVALDAEDGEDLWVRLGNEPAYVGIVIEGGVIYATTENMEGEVRLASIDSTDGEQGWSESIGTGTTGIPALDEVRVYVAADRLVALERATGERAWEFEAPEGTLQGPVVADEFVAAGGDSGNWYLIERVEGEDFTELAYCEDCSWLAAVGEDNLLYLAEPELAEYDVLNVEDGALEPEWTYSVSGGEFTQPVVGPRLLVAGTTSAGMVVAFER